MPYKAPEKQRASNRERQRRFYERHKAERASSSPVVIPESIPDIGLVPDCESPVIAVVERCVYCGRVLPEQLDGEKVCLQCSTSVVRSKVLKDMGYSGHVPPVGED